jgi:hypothetical protein
MVKVELASGADSIAAAGPLHRGECATIYLELGMSMRYEV